MANIELKEITKRYKSVTALKGISFDVEDGEFFVILGPTGAGKTTTLRVIAGLEKQDSGTVYFDGMPIDELSPAERDTAFVFQQYSLYPDKTVFENLAFPLQSPMRKMGKEEISKRVKGTAEVLRIDHLLDRRTANLSGGEMQRVSIGRAIVREPRVFLMDEPLSNLDFKLRETLRVELQHIQKSQGSTTLFVTHDQIEALTMAERIAVLNEGEIVQIGSAHDIYDRPDTVFVAQLVGTPRINLMGAVKEDGILHVQGAPIQIPVPASEEHIPSACQMGVRPEDIVPHDSGEFAGEVALTEPLGVETVIHINTGDQTLLSTTSGISHWSRGDNLRFNIVQERLHFFDAQGQRVPA